MKINLSNMLWIQTVVLMIGLVFAWDSMVKNISDLFIGALGLLTFISIFYNLAISKGMETIDKVVSLLNEKQNAEIERVLKDILKEKDKISKSNQLNDLLIKINETESFVGYLNFNKWVFISVASYLISIMFYLLPHSTSTTAIQILSFWIGFTISTLIVSSWFIANSNMIKK